MPGFSWSFHACFPSRLPVHIVCVPVPVNTQTGTNESSNVTSDCSLTFTTTCYGCQTLTNCSSLWGTDCLECSISIAIQAHDLLWKTKRERGQRRDFLFVMKDFLLSVWDPSDLMCGLPPSLHQGDNRSANPLA